MSSFVRQAEPPAVGAICTTPPDVATEAGPQATVLRGLGWRRLLPTWFQLFPPWTITWRRHEIPITNLSPALAGLRILHLSDFHFRRHTPIIWETLLSRIRLESPDLILLTGDFVDSKRNPYPAIPYVLHMLKGLHCRLGCYGIVGNHDDYNVAYELRDSGVVFLDGKNHVLEENGAAIELIGLPGAERLDLERPFLRRLPQKSDGCLRIVMSHHPDNLMLVAALGPDVYLAGHTHGGQICLPGGWPILRHDGLPRRLTRGVHELEKMWISVSRGIGWTGLPCRAFCPPEVNELRLLRSGNYSTDAA